MEWQFCGVATDYGCMIMCDCLDGAKDTSQEANKKINLVNCTAFTCCHSVTLPSKSTNYNKVDQCC